MLKHKQAKDRRHDSNNLHSKNVLRLGPDQTLSHATTYAGD